MEKFKTNPFIFILVVTSMVFFPMIFSSCVKEPLIKPTPTTPNNNGNGKPTYCDTCLPPITQQGYNFFGCKINGKNWTPKDGFMQPGLRADMFNFRITVIAYNSKIGDGLSFSLMPVKDSILVVFPKDSLFISTATYGTDDLQKFYDTEYLQTGYIHFTRVDYQQGIFSGTFAFDLYNNNGDTLHITEGRFDLKK